MSKSLRVLKTIAATRRWRADHPTNVVLVPTMGALHAGHGALIARARKLAGADGRVIVSIFVNPTQFGPKEDLSRYPRPLAADLALCERLGADAVFHPSAAEMYPDGFSTYVDEQTVSSGLCGTSRPGHFRGVCTVVLKLFTITLPNSAVFGLKDFQQCQVIARMVRDLDVPVKLVFAPTVRAADGLALSSRNAYLSPEERAQAPALRRGLLAAQAKFRAGERSAAKLRAAAVRALAAAPLGRVDYLDVVSAGSLAPTPKANRGDTMAAAVFFGRTA